MKNSVESAVCLSFDLDWAPDYILDDLHALLKEYGVKATLFFTHTTEATKRLTTLTNCEVGVHPNFLVDKQADEVLGAITSSYPQAKGVRNHVLYYHSRLLPLFHEKGMRYFSNDLLFLEAELRPTFDWSGMVRLPIFWEDDVHAIYFDGDFSLDKVDLRSKGLKVFNFHPVHLFLNTPTMQTYTKVKDRLQESKTALESRHDGSGVRSFFNELLENLDHQQCYTLLEVAEAFRDQNRYQGKFEKFLQQSKE